MCYLSYMEIITYVEGTEGFVVSEHSQNILYSRHSCLLLFLGFVCFMCLCESLLHLFPLVLCCEQRVFPTMYFMFSCFKEVILIFWCVVYMCVCAPRVWCPGR